MNTPLKLSLPIVLIIFGQSLFAKPPETATEYDGHFYELVPTDGPISWRQAAQKAKERGGSLASLESDDERNFVSLKLKAEARKMYWVGISRIYYGNDLSDALIHPRTEHFWFSGRPVMEDLFTSSRKSCYGFVAAASLGFVSLEDFMKGPDPRMIRSHIRSQVGGYIVEWEKDFVGNWHVATLPELGIDEKEPDVTDNNKGMSLEKATLQGVEISKMIGEAIAGSPKIELEQRQASINALLVVEIADQSHAGSTSKLNITAVPTTKTEELSSLRFNQEVGPMMEKAMAEVVRFQRIRNGGWSYGHQIEIAFKDKYVPKDGPSAAVACALLLESISTGVALDKGFAVTGDLNADGEVQPIGGVSAKIKAAARAQSSRVAVPSENENGIRDLVVIEGFTPVVTIPVFTIESFDEARDVAMKNAGDNLRSALEEFAAIQKLHQKDPASFYQSLRHPSVRNKLTEVRKNAPNLLSAKILHEISAGQFSNKLSLVGSLSWIERQTSEVLAGIRETANAGNTTFEGDGLADAIRSLQKMRTKIDERCIPYNDSIVDFGKLIHGFITRPPAKGSSSQRAINQVGLALSRIDSTKEKLLRDAKIVSELLD